MSQLPQMDAWGNWDQHVDDPWKRPAEPCAAYLASRALADANDRHFRFLRARTKLGLFLEARIAREAAAAAARAQAEAIARAALAFRKGWRVFQR